MNQTSRRFITVIYGTRFGSDIGSSRFVPPNRELQGLTDLALLWNSATARGAA